MTHDAYRETLGYMSHGAGCSGRLTEHSARRGGAQYHYYVLGYSLRAIMQNFRWESMAEMMKYLGIDDTLNPYDQLGFTGVSL